MTQTDTPGPSQAEGAPDGAEAELAAAVEAVLFAADRPLPAAKVSEIGELGGVRNVRRAVEALNRQYERSGRTFRIVEIAGGYQYQTLPEYADVLGRLRRSRTDARLSQAALETLAIVAYRQPVLRADVEAIRGVACGEVLRGLMEKDLVRIAGRAEEIGRPMLYGTTRRFLEVFGLGSLDDLPSAEQLRQPPGADAEGPAAADGTDAEEDEGEEEEGEIDEAEEQDDEDEDDEDDEDA